MIHVAPCSCELHVRIRELEAELAQERQLAEAAWRGDAALLARAEKAEKERNDWERTANENGARVAELERRYGALNVTSFGDEC